MHRRGEWRPAPRGLAAGARRCFRVVFAHPHAPSPRVITWPETTHQPRHGSSSSGATSAAHGLPLRGAIAATQGRWLEPRSWHHLRHALRP